MFRFSEIVDNYKQDGIKSLKKLHYEVGTYEFKSSSFPAKTIYIDDFASKGAEVNHFQNYENLSETIIDYRYDIFNRFRKIWHVSSNVAPDELEIDGRSIGRIIEMFNIVKLDEKNWRLT